MKQYNYHMISMPSAKCHVEFVVDNFSCLKNIRLWSYTTLILDVAVGLPNDGHACNVMVCYPVDCSHTTARHVNRFTTELFGENKYFDFKGVETHTVIKYDDMLLKAVEMHERYVYSGKSIR
nr:MAG TPA: hypothetical protein [Bacteriophage sp.]